MNFIRKFFDSIIHWVSPPKQSLLKPSNDPEIILRLLKPGDLICLSLKHNFCNFLLLQQNYSRFSEKQLLSKEIKGITVSCHYRVDIMCHVLEVETVSLLSEKNQISILQDEIEFIKVVS